MSLIDRFLRRSSPPPPSTPIDPPKAHLSVRDQTQLCVFFGVYLGVDTRRYPELSSQESIPDDVLHRFEHGPVGGHFWSLLRFAASRSTTPIWSWALVLTAVEHDDITNDPALPGTWWIDGNSATPRNHGVMTLTPAMVAPLVVSLEAETERAALAAELGHDGLLGPVAWHAISVIDLKHT
jgi:hypothetical protein